MAFTRKTEIIKTTRIETADGIIIFRKMAEYRNDEFYGFYYIKNDNRYYTSIGNSYMEYKNETGYKAAIKRAMKLSV